MKFARIVLIAEAASIRASLFVRFSMRRSDLFCHRSHSVFAIVGRLPLRVVLSTVVCFARAL